MENNLNKNIFRDIKTEKFEMVPMLLSEKLSLIKLVLEKCS